MVQDAIVLLTVSRPYPFGSLKPGRAFRDFSHNQFVHLFWLALIRTLRSIPHAADNALNTMFDQSDVLDNFANRPAVGNWFEVPLLGGEVPGRCQQRITGLT